MLQFFIVSIFDALFFKNAKSPFVFGLTGVVGAETLFKARVVGCLTTFGSVPLNIGIK